jgi:putative peptidoglycan lipid II flippase
MLVLQTLCLARLSTPSNTIDGLVRSLHCLTHESNTNPVPRPSHCTIFPHVISDSVVCPLSLPFHLSHPTRRAEGAKITPMIEGQMADAATTTTTPQRVARATVIVAACFVASRMLGLARDVLIAARFGTSPDYAAYVAAFRIPDLVFLVVMSGAFGSAFIPVYAELLARRQVRSAWTLANTLLTISLALFFLVWLVIFLIADIVIGSIVAPGLPPSERALAADLTRFLMLSPLLLGIGAAAKAMLESEARFTEPAIAPMLYNIGIILGALLLAPRWGVYGLSLGVVLGAGAYAAFQLWALGRTGWRYRPMIQRHVPGLREVARMLGPRLLAQVAMQANIVVLTNFASRIGQQQIAALQYAYQIFLLPYGIVALSVATVLLPTLSQYRTHGQLAELRELFGRALRSAVLLVTPAIVFFAAFDRSIVQTLFQFGAFTATSTTLVSEALRWFAPGLIAFTVVELLTRLSYSFKDSTAPVIAGGIAVACNLLSSALLLQPMGHRGLALSLSIATTVEMVVLAVLVQRRTGVSLVPTLRELGRAIPGILLLAVVSVLFSGPLAQATDPSHGRSVTQFALFVYTLTALLASYLTLLLVFRQPDILALLDRLIRYGRAPARRVRTGILDR